MFVKLCVYIWIQYSALARACEEDALQRINIGLIHISFLEERIMAVTKFALSMINTFLTELRFSKDYRLSDTEIIMGMKHIICFSCPSSKLRRSK